MLVGKVDIKDKVKVLDDVKRVDRIKVTDDNYEYFNYNVCKYKITVRTSDGIECSYVKYSDSMDIQVLVLDTLGIRGTDYEYDIMKFVEYISKDMFSGGYGLVNTALIDLSRLTYRDINVLDIFEDNVYSLPSLYNLRESISKEYATIERVLERIDRAIKEKHIATNNGMLY